MTSQEIPKSPERLAILEKIAQYEREGRFDEDVENDPPSRVLLPEEIEYADRRFSAECRRTAAFGAAYLYFWNLRRKKEIILCKTEGLEHLAGVKGAVITCNHFHPMDSFIMQKVFDASKHPKRMYRVIREGNYTSFPGFYGFLMRNCNTLPLSSNMQTMKKFLRAVDQVLSEGNCLLIYPEQSMWWNYRKPKPLKPGAFDMGAEEPRTGGAVLHHDGGQRLGRRRRVPCAGIHAPFRRAHLAGRDPVPPRRPGAASAEDGRFLPGDL